MDCIAEHFKGLFVICDSSEFLFQDVLGRHCKELQVAEVSEKLEWSGTDVARIKSLKRMSFFSRFSALF